MISPKYPKDQYKGMKARLLTARKKHRLSMKATAPNTQQGLSRWENDKAIPSVTNFIRWANRLGFDVKMVKMDDKG